MTRWLYAALAAGFGVLAVGAVRDSQKVSQGLHSLPRWKVCQEWRDTGAYAQQIERLQNETQGESEEHDVDPVLEIIYSDGNYLVVNKPYDVRMDGEHEITVLSLIHKSFTGINQLPKLHFAHRLDYATSGVLCCALNKKAIRAACHLFETRQTRKQYVAICFGHLEQDSYEVSEPIAEYLPGPDEPRRVPTGAEATTKDFRMTVGVKGRTGREAHTSVTVVERGWYGGAAASKVLLRPVTGRRHQLRVHLAHIGHPIVGDYTYAHDDKSPRMMLHAWRLSLPLPQALGGLLELEAPDPFLGLLRPVPPPESSVKP